MPDQGIRMQLAIGPSIPVPAPYNVMDALIDLQVTNNDRDRDGFQMRFSLGKDSSLDYGLLANGYFEPLSRASVMVIINALPEMLINGVITDHQLAPSNRPGESILTVTGEDVSLLMDLEELSETYPNQSDSSIVEQILGSYPQLGLSPIVTSTNDTPKDTERVTTQQGTDLSFIRELARRNGFVFYIEAQALGTNVAYWGLDGRIGPPQPTLSMNMGADTNVDSSINFHFNALGPEAPQVVIVDPDNGEETVVQIQQSTRPPLSRNPAVALRRTLPRNAANLNSTQASLLGFSSSTQAADAVTANGEIDSVRYGKILRGRRLVGVRGVGDSYDGLYYVKSVTHHIKRGEYKQSFTLSREGRGALTPVVML